jgi:hypothetical protein
MALFQDETVIEILLSSKRLLPSSVYRQVLFHLEMPLLDKLIVKFAQCPLPLQENLIDILRIRNERTYAFLHLLERLLETDQTELRIRALKALSNFGYMSPEGLQLISGTLERWKNRSWQEKLMAAKLMGSVRDTVFLPHLHGMMGDESYLVREAAAAAISRYKNGAEWLRFIYAHHSDRYARDMAHVALKKGMVR